MGIIVIDDGFAFVRQDDSVVARADIVSQTTSDKVMIFLLIVCSPNNTQSSDAIGIKAFSSRFETV